MLKISLSPPLPLTPFLPPRKSPSCANANSLTHSIHSARSYPRPFLPAGACAGPPKTFHFSSSLSLPLPCARAGGYLLSCPSFDSTLFQQSCQVAALKRSCKTLSVHSRFVIWHGSYLAKFFNQDSGLVLIVAL